MTEKCPFCDYEWNYHGISILILCPKCRRYHRKIKGAKDNVPNPTNTIQ